MICTTRYAVFRPIQTLILNRRSGITSAITSTSSRKQQSTTLIGKVIKSSNGWLLCSRGRRVFSLCSFERDGNGAFLASIEVTKMLDQRRRSIQVSDKTNAGMGDFTIETDQEVSTKA